MQRDYRYAWNATGGWPAPSSSSPPTTDFELSPHRLRGEKSTPYEETTRVPIYVRGPGVRGGARAPEPGGQCRPGADGRRVGRRDAARKPRRTLAGITAAARRAPARTPWRHAYPPNQLSRVRDPELAGRADPRVHLRRVCDRRAGAGTTTDCDPYQLRNVAGRASPTLLSNLSALTAALATCKADGCRQLEDAPVASLRSPVVPRR